MPPKSKTAKDREAANRIAEVMYAAWKKLPEDEQKAAIKGIQSIKIAPSRKTPKLSPV